MSKRTTRNESSEPSTPAPRKRKAASAGRTRCRGAENPSPSQEDR